jgi:hypothetical protein
MESISEGQYRNATNANDGWCTGCKEIIEGGGVEPDAEGYRCDQCDGMTVFGVEQALLMGLIDIGESIGRKK